MARELAAKPRTSKGQLAGRVHLSEEGLDDVRGRNRLRQTGRRPRPLDPSRALHETVGWVGLLES
jgi:hypothetical protein